MTLPDIKLPKVDLPFDIPVLLHPAVDHFAIALPVIILLLEFYNLFARRKSIGAFSFILLLLTVVIFALAYLTGSVDGKEAYMLLSPEGQTELKAHKLLGIYLLFGSVIVLFFKLLAMTGKSFLKFLFFVVLIGMILVTFKQGKEGGELVYEYGANVERVKTLDDELFDAKEALEEMEEETKASIKVETIKKIDSTEANTTAIEEATPEERERTDSLLKSAAEKMEEVNEKAIDTAKKSVENVSTSIKEEVQDASQKVLESEKETVEKVMDSVPAMNIERPVIQTH